MRKTKIVLSVICLVAIILSLLPACNNKPKSKDVVILATGNVQCALDYNIGYDGVSAYKKQMQQENAGVALVDCGGFASGEQIGTLSEGECAVDVMNKVGYDYVVPTRGEFRYNLEQAKKLLSSLKAEKLISNFEYTGTGTNYLDDVKGYAVKTIGDKKIGFVGVTAPETVQISVPTYYQENGKIVYNFYGDSKEGFYKSIQTNIDKCKNEGAQYVFLISHLGVSAADGKVTSVNDMVGNVTGVDGVLNSSGNTVIKGTNIKDKDKKDVPVISTAENLYYLGKAVISEDGKVKMSCVYDTEMTSKDKELTDYIKGVYTNYGKKLDEVVATTDVDLKCENDKNVRVVRYQETNMGDFCADAFRRVAETDVAIVNGGGIRDSLPAGETTLRKLLAVYPYGNQLCTVKATGQQILDMLEIGAVSAKKEVGPGDEDKSNEIGSVFQVSGIKYTIDTSVASPYRYNSFSIIEKVGTGNRVKDVSILNKDTNQYEPLNLNKEYTLATTNYVIGGDNSALKNNEVNNSGTDSDVKDYEVLTIYFKSLDGNLSSYKTIGDRITIK